MPESWEKQPDESEPAFAAFRIYRDLEQGQRSITRVAQECTKERSLIARWSSRHSWQQRVAD